MHPPSRHVAISAAACRFPAAGSPEELWVRSIEGICAVPRKPPERWGAVPDRARAALLDDVASFDAALFGMGDEEAAFTDPQQRMVLEVAHEALERAGLAGPRRTGRRVGVFVGAGQADYQEGLLRRLWSGAPVPASAAVGNLRNLMAARIAHCLDLRGPALVVDTACSSSLVAIHQARESLLRGECDLALAGGVTLNLTPTSWMMLDRAGAISPTGSMRPFGEGADGIVIGDGCGILVLERLEDAVARGACTLAVLRGSAVNNDGRSVNPMAPRRSGQIAVMRAAWEHAGLDPATATYVEAHGTGTRVGDAVESRSISEVFARTDRATPLWLGSVKGNLGHLLNAAGMPSVIKVVECLRHRRLPPSLCGDAINSRLGLDAGGLALVREPTAWEGALLRAGINGFGFGGTNAHLILEEAPSGPRAPREARRPALWTLSARSEGALRRTAARLAEWLRDHPNADRAVVARDASLAHDPMEHRLAFVGEELVVERLEAFARTGDGPDLLVGVAPRRVRGVAEAPDDPHELARRFVSGQPVDRLRYEGDAGAAQHALPTYPFERRRHWVDAPTAGTSARGVDHPLLQRQLDLSIDRATFSACIAPTEPLVAEHRIHGVPLLPGAGCVEMMRAAAERALGRAPGGLSEVTFAAPVTAGEELRVRVERRDGDVVATILGEDGTLRARARVLDEPSEPVGPSAQESIDRPFEPRSLYAELTARGMHHGPSFQAVRAIDVGALEARADLRLPEGAVDERYGAHPALLDAAMQPIAAVLLGRAGDRPGLWVPVHVEAIELWGRLTRAGATHVRLRSDAERPGSTIRCDVVVTDESGTPCVGLRGLRLHRVDADAIRTRRREAAESLRAVGWEIVPAERRSLEGERWLVVPAAHAASAGVVSRLRSAGARVERVDLDGFEAALGRGPRARAVLFLCATPDDDTGPVRDLAAVARAVDHTADGRRPDRVVTMTAGATDGGSPAQAAAAALCFALPGEVPGLRAATVDLPAGATTEQLAEAAPTAAAIGADGVFRLRDGALARRRVGPLEGPADRERVPLRDEGVYLVTGGASGIGFEVAASLADGRRTLVLAGRRALESDPDRAARIELLRGRCARVEYVRCDVADRDAVGGLVARIALDHGALHGVVHAAGVVLPGRLRRRTDHDIERVLAPKVHGTRLLWEEILRRELTVDFVALFSSVSTCIEGLGGGIGDYVAANAYLDAYAEARRDEGHPFVSIGWSAWSETGMGAEPLLLRSLEAKGLAGIGSREGVRAFHAALAAGRAHVVVAPRAEGRPQRAPVDLAPAKRDDSSSKPRPRAGGATPSSVEAIASELRALVAGPLEIDPGQVPEDESFLSMGLDSLVALELVKALEERTGRELPTTLFFEHPTIAELSAHLAGSGYDGAATEAAQETEGTPAEPAERALTRTQRAFWIQQRLHPERAPFSFLRQTVRGPLDTGALRDAARAVCDRHPMLRASIRDADGEPVLAFASRAEPVVRDHGATGDVEALADRVTRAPGEPSRPPAWRIDVARDAGGRFQHVLICAHHLIADAWSLHLIAVDLWRAYARIRRGEAPALGAAPMDAEPTSDDATLERDRAHWRDEANALSPLPLPYDGAAEPSVLTAVTTRLPRGQSAAFVDAARRSGVSPFHLSLSLYAQLLGRWADTDRVTVNVARARRDLRRPGADRAVGCFADTLPLRLELRPGESALELAARARDRMATLEAHGSLTSVDLAPLLPRDAEGLRVASPASYSFARFPVDTPEDAPEVVETAGRTASPATRLGLAAWEHRGSLCFALNFPTDRFTRDTGRRFLRELRDAHANLAAPVRQKGSGPIWLTERLVGALRAKGDGVAMVCGGRAVTGAELEAASGAVAARLHEDGIGRGDLVGVVAEQGVEAVVAIVGVLRAGAGWVPMDPEHPATRLREQATRARVRAVLLGGSATDPGHDVRTHRVEELVARGGEAPSVPPAKPHEIAYVIFTSGSTGRPKGVPITHAAMAGYLDWAIETFAYGPRDVLLGTSSPCFDASVRQLLAPLLVGARLVAAPRELARDPDALLDVLERERVTVLSTVPSLLARVVSALDRRPDADLSALRFVHCGGEALPPGLVRGLHDRLRPAPPIANLYGPTETTINATHHVVREAPPGDVERIPIGRPVGGATLRIVDGELWVGGRGLSPGYLDDPEQTAESFVRGPDGERMYRTGDRVAERADGDLDFLGRVDDQVKVQGHRIEPAEIEAILCTHPRVALAAVRAVGDGPGRRLEAWIEPRGEAPRDAELRELLGRRLPAYMCPRRFHVVAALPITPTGKVDRAALVASVAAAQGAGPGTPGTAPATPTELVVARAFAEVLGTPTPGRDDDFFVLGGDSMGVLDLFARLEELSPLPRAATLYRTRTVRALARAIDDFAEGPAAHSRRTDTNGEWFPLSPTQRGFVAARRLDGGRGAQWSALIRLEGELDADVFRDSVAHLVERHPMLRTVIDVHSSPPRQRVLQAAAPPLEHVSPCTEADVERLWREAQSQGFDPATAPPLRMVLCRLGPDRHALIIAADHLLGDALSGWILARELLQAYDAMAEGRLPRLPPIPATFHQYVTTETLRAPDRASAEHWRHVFETPHRWSTAWHEPAGGPAGAQVVEIPGVRVEELKAAARARGHTLHGLLLGAWAHVLAERSGQRDLVLGCALSGREGPPEGLHAVFGPFATALPVRLETQGDPEGTLDRAARAFAEAHAHALTPGEIVRALDQRVDPTTASGSRLFFTFMDFESLGTVRGDRLRIDWERSITEGALPGNVELQLAARRLEGSLRLTLQAAPQVLGEDGLAALAQRLTATLDALAGPAPARHAVRTGRFTPSELDAALVGYLPAPRQVARAIGLDVDDSLREAWRARMFPGGEPRWVERLDTDLGSSGLLCLPLFADELSHRRADALAEQVGAALDVIGRTPIRAVSLAGMLPALTGYGHAALRRTGRPSSLELTTGHATTVVAVVKTVISAARQASIDLAAADVAVIGVGSIGGAAIELLLDTAPHARRIVLCDLPRARGQVEEVARRLRDSHRYRGAIEIAEASTTELPEAVYRAGVIVGAASSPAVLDVRRLAPGTVVVDDSFPHLFDEAHALERADALWITGGGLLACPRIERTLALPADLDSFADAIASAVPAFGVASCQLEPLLRRARPHLPAVHGPVTLAVARSYWEAAGDLGLTAAPLHVGARRLPLPTDDAGISNRPR